MKNQIELIDVVKKYKETIVLSGLSFAIETNEFVALVGNNGCGKTTTINVLCNLLSYESGDVIMFGKRVTPSYVSYKNKLGVLLSKPVFVNEFTPNEYLNFICKFQNVDRNERYQRIEDVINIFKIANSKSKKIENYSSGDQMKISFAAAIIHNPPVLILDEPFIHLDIQTIDFLMSLLHSFKKTKSIFITSHNLDLITDLCERFLIMEGGKIINDFSKETDKSGESIKTLIKERIVRQKPNIDTLDWLR